MTISDEPNAGVRPARPDDVPQLVALVRALADYERAAHEVALTDGALHAALFDESPRVHCLVAEADGQVAGFALWFFTYSTWLGRHGIYLEDLFVRPAFRGRGLGRSLLGRLAGIAVEEGCGRLEWAVLDWNAPAQGFYRRLGAGPLDEWTVWRLTGPELTALGEAHLSSPPSRAG